LPTATLPGQHTVLTEKVWGWTGFSDPLQKFMVERPENYTLSFQTDGTVNIRADCNYAKGIFSLDSSRIKIEIGPVNAALCPVGSRGEEFLKILGDTAAISFREDNLLLDLMADGGTMVFTPLGSNSLLKGENEVQVDLAATLGNLNYPGLFPDRDIELKDGYVEYQDGSSGKPFVLLITRMIALGDINADGNGDAVAILENYSSGSGIFVFLAPVLNIWTDPLPLDAVMIGDRTPVKYLAIEGNQVVVEMIGPGPGDPACCSSWNVRKVLQLEDNQLVETDSSNTSKTSLYDLSGTTWKLVNFDGDKDPLASGVEITLHFEGDQIRGLAGCNNYNATVSGDEQQPEIFTVSPIATTRKNCDEMLNKQEQDFLSRLARVSTWRYNFGYLGLIYKQDDGQMGELILAPKGL
jgi:heat shock protein HslJ